LPRIAHIINPVDVSVEDEFYKIQALTFSSILAARKFSFEPNSISLGSTQFDLDTLIMPDGFSKLTSLKKSILDINPKLRGKKLPLIADIFSKFSELPDSDFYIYTNADIGLMPYFYNTIIGYLDQGHDAIVINRRRVSRKHLDKPNLNLIYSDIGNSHPGFDCFIFKKELLNQFYLGNICVGIPFVEVTLIHNIFALASNPLFVPDAHLTFHIGKEVMPKRDKYYYHQNRTEFFTKIYPVLKPHFKLEKFPYSALPFYKRALKWMLNPSLFTANYFKLEGEHLFNELRWRILQK
jgi:hypothetical protein